MMQLFRGRSAGLRASTSVPLRSGTGILVAVGGAVMGGGLLWMQFAGFTLWALLATLGGAALWVTTAVVAMLRVGRFPGDVESS
ncbi:hypothetical protein ACFVTX_04075 [Agromyces sp. NPDC058136]|uniref:hypothetical protein n=1 Tax=Agromyces sp. NPDC058136 TaxID=3346354 RepID=UPI0036DE37B1